MATRGSSGKGSGREAHRVTMMPKDIASNYADTVVRRHPRGAVLMLSGPVKLVAETSCILHMVSQAAGANRSVTATVGDGNRWQAAFAGSDTVTLPIGRYVTEWQTSIGAATRRIVRGADIMILASLSAGDTIGPTPAERRLAVAERALERLSQSGVETVSLEAGSTTFESRDALLAYIARLRDEVGVERLASRQQQENDFAE